MPSNKFNFKIYFLVLFSVLLYGGCTKKPYCNLVEEVFSKQDLPILRINLNELFDKTDSLEQEYCSGNYLWTELVVDQLYLPVSLPRILNCGEIICFFSKTSIRYNDKTDILTINSKEIPQAQFKSSIQQLLKKLDKKNKNFKPHNFIFKCNQDVNLSSLKEVLVMFAESYVEFFSAGREKEVCKKLEKRNGPISVEDTLIDYRPVFPIVPIIVIEIR